MLLLKIDASSREPVYRQVVRQIIELVEGGALKEEDILPPTRELAERLSISRFTVAQAYRELWAKGYVESRPGSYTRVRKRPRLAAGGPREGGKAARLEDLYSEGSRRLAGVLPLAAFPVGPTSHNLSFPSSPGVVDFTPLSLDPRIFPVDRLRSAFDLVITRRRAGLLNYADPAGYPPLREFIADRMRAHAVEADPDEVVITHGSLHGLELVARLFVDSGRTVALEQPTFSSVMPLFLLRGARLGLIPMRPDGMDLGRLERLMEERKGSAGAPALVYTIPSFHNPTGVTSGQPHRERLLGLCDTYRVPLAEDSFQEEITYFGKAVLPIKSMDSSGIVFYLGSFSKVLFPGLRIGWVLARRDAAERLALIKRVSDISCSPIVQAALHHFCESGSYEAQLRRVNRLFARRMRLAVEALRAHLPAERAAFDEPSGGYLIWIRLSGLARSEREIQDALRARGVAAAPGGLFFAKPPRERFIRLSISSLDEVEIEEGARRLGKALRAL
jgi:DNA-binding transcriptional MocR family regulator